MQVEFRTRRLRGAYEREAVAVRLWDAEAARWYAHFVDYMLEAGGIADLYGYRRMRFHPLHGERDSEHAMRLSGRWRLIVTVQGDTVTIEEVSRHYGD